MLFINTPAAGQTVILYLWWELHLLMDIMSYHIKLQNSCSKSHKGRFFRGNSSSFHRFWKNTSMQESIEKTTTPLNRVDRIWSSLSWFSEGSFKGFVNPNKTTIIILTLTICLVFFLPRSCCENLPPKISTSLSRISVLSFWITPRKHCEHSLKVVPLQTEISACTTRGCGCSLDELLTQSGYINSDIDILRLREDDDEPTVAAPPAARGRDTAKKRSQPASPTPANGANGAVLKICLCLFPPPGLTRLHPWPLLRARWEWMLRRSLYPRLMRREEASRKRFDKVWQPCPLQ